ncbi:MAG: ribosome biogenesis GTPase Der [Helicobacter sp.]|nr:ribosome biogenesis GTPase Der [Helicobacter sp.]
MPQETKVKKIAIVGRPNVGKSSLFNRLIASRKAITSDVAGTTRDVCIADCKLGDSEFLLSDTGGVAAESQGAASLFDAVAQSARNEAANADILLFVIDGKYSVQDCDIALFRELQRLHKPMFLVVNKLDNSKEEQRLWEYSAFGIEDIFGISVAHNRGIAELADAIAARLTHKSQASAPQTPDVELLEALEAQSHDVDSDDRDSSESGEGMSALDLPLPPIKIAIIGRVNVGKSSLLNALLGQQRSVVSPVAGTTIDPVDAQCKWKEHDFLFIDTAGLRRKSKIEGIEKFALMRTKDMLEQADIALLVLDSSAPLVELDEKMGALALEHKLGVILVLTKTDIKNQPIEQLQKEIRERFKYLAFAPIVSVCAQSGRKIEALKAKIVEVFDNLSRRIPTAVLNDVLLQACSKHPIPSDRGKLVRVYYATQYKNSPPHIALVMNRPNALHFSYKRYLANTLRQHFAFEGVPLFIETKKKEREARH